MRNKDRESEVDQVRQAIEILAMQKNIEPTKVTLKSVQKFIGGKSNGTLGALVNQVKSELFKSKEYDQLDLSHRFKSALSEEISRFKDNTRECANEEMSELNNLNNELIYQIKEAEEKSTELQNIIVKQEKQANARHQEIIIEMAKAEQHVISANERIKNQTKELNEARQTLEQKSAKLTELKTLTEARDLELKSAHNNVDLTTKKMYQLKENVANLEREKALIQQEGEHLKSNLEQQEKQNQKIERENQRLLDKQESFLQMIQVHNLNQIKADVTDSLANSKVPDSKDKKSKTQGLDNKNG
jgi:chromosome segregation ATPase